MSAQLAEHLLAVLWMDRCRQAQRLAEGRSKLFREEVVRTLLTSFITEQRWGLGVQVINEEGMQEPGVLNFDPSDWADEEHPHFLEQCIFDKIVLDVERGEWNRIEHYMDRAEFFHDLPAGSIRRLPEGSRMR